MTDKTTKPSVDAETDWIDEILGEVEQRVLALSPPSSKVYEDLAVACNLMAAELADECSYHTLRKTWNEVEVTLKAALASPSPVASVEREALELAYDELKKHDADYHHRTSVEVNNRIVAALSLDAGDRG